MAEAYAGGKPQSGGSTAANRDRRERVRTQAAQCFADGRPDAQIAAGLQVGLRQVEKWRQAWPQGEADALRSRARMGGRAGRCAARQVGSRPDSWSTHGDADDAVDAGPGDRAFQRAIGHRLRPARVSLLLRLNGWLVQVPGRRAVQRDEQAVTAWEQGVWPQAGIPRASRGTWICFEGETGQGLRAPSGGP